MYLTFYQLLTCMGVIALAFTALAFIIFGVGFVIGTRYEHRSKKQVQDKEKEQSPGGTIKGAVSSSSAYKAKY